MMNNYLIYWFPGLIKVWASFCQRNSLAFQKFFYQIIDLIPERLQLRIIVDNWKK